VLVVDIATPDLLGPAIANRAWWFQIFKRDSVIRLVTQAVDSIGARRAAAIAWVPTVAPVVAALDPPRLVFDSLDNWLIHPVLRRLQAEASEGYGQLLPRADAVFASAPRSADALAQWRRDVAVLPNGVDPSMFRTLRPRPADLPRGPIVGYAGKLAERIDTDLVLSVSKAMPDTSFVFIGPVLGSSVASRLRRRPNVLLLGDRHYSLMPAYLQHFDAAWIPHTVGEGETGGDPIKLYEYWAAGKAVVSTRIDGMERYASSIAMVSTADEAVSALSDALLAGVAPEIPPDREWSAIAKHLVDALVAP
jgi:glycosyltransferase involved in cell wall biosynthesis